MLTIKNVTIKNFLSVGNVTQAVSINETGLTLVLGNNVDMGGDGSRNGVGKTTLINAISYALFGSALFNIKKSNLINKINNKHMTCTVDFEKDGAQYRIERGRSPNVFKFYVNEIDNSDGKWLACEEICRRCGLSYRSVQEEIITMHDYTRGGGISYVDFELLKKNLLR